jgi:hypothetical protein
MHAIPITRNAGIHSHGRPLGHDIPAITAQMGTHQSRTHFHPRNMSSDSHRAATEEFRSSLSTWRFNSFPTVHLSPLTVRPLSTVVFHLSAADSNDTTNVLTVWCILLLPLLMFSSPNLPASMAGSSARGRTHSPLARNHQPALNFQKKLEVVS